MSDFKKVGWALFTKASIVTAAVLTYAYHTNVKRIDYNIFERKSAVAPFAYSNPAILEVKWEANDEGRIETYLVNTETGKKVEIMYDMLPRNSTMVEAMRDRASEGYSEPGFTDNNLEKVLGYEDPGNKPASLWDRLSGNFSDKR